MNYNHYSHPLKLQPSIQKMYKPFHFIKNLFKYSTVLPINTKYLNRLVSIQIEPDIVPIRVDHRLERPHNAAPLPFVAGHELANNLFTYGIVFAMGSVFADVVEEGVVEVVDGIGCNVQPHGALEEAVGADGILEVGFGEGLVGLGAKMA